MSRNPGQGGNRTTRLPSNLHRCLRTGGNSLSVSKKITLSALPCQHLPTIWQLHSNFRVPLPAFERRFSAFVDITADTDTGNLSDINAATNEGDASISATVRQQLTDTFDLGPPSASTAARTSARR